MATNTQISSPRSPSTPDTSTKTQSSSPTDLRKMKYGIALKTSGSAGQIGDLLEQHCNGKWRIILCDLETGNGVKELKIMFELESDKNTFKRVVGQAPVRSAA